jgi:mannose-6-phosphate isomerase-like protein (cupin superfamily)
MAKLSIDPSAAVPDGRAPAKQQLFDPTQPGPWRGHLPGEALGTTTTILAYGNEAVGTGPALHVHPYDELFVVLEGRGRFYVGDAVIDAQAGEVVLGPKGLPHRFENLGPGRLQTIDIHLGPQWLQADL